MSKPTNGMNDDQYLRKLISCFERSQSGNASRIKQAQEELENEHQTRRFGVLLLKLITDSNVAANIKLGASVYFKNYVKTHWGREEAIIDPQDQRFIKVGIVRVMLQADKNSQRLLSEAITIIASHDFYTKWDTLLPELINKLKSEQSFDSICGVLRIIQSITTRYPSTESTLPMVEEIKYILELFQDLWLQLLNRWYPPIHSSFSPNSSSDLSSLNPSAIHQMKYQIFCVEQLILIFFDLNSVDLIAFFENNMSSWVQIFEKLLTTVDSSNLFQTPSDLPGPIDRLRTAIVRALKLFNCKYEEEYGQYVPTFMRHICSLLTTINDDERYDHLAAESIGYLSSVASQQWNAKLFSDASVLHDIVTRILIRNIRLRESDVNMYEMNGEDWVRRDMEGSDLYTRRRGAVDLVRGLMQNFEQQVSSIIMQQMQQLMQHYAQHPKNNFVDKDTAIHLLLAVSIKGQTKLHGATKINKHVPVMQFFQQHILPELATTNVSHPIIVSDCLKFVILFRSQWDKANFLQLLDMACTFLAQEDYVLHTYAAIAIDKILAMTVFDANTKTSFFQYPKEVVIQKIEQVLIALFTVLNTREESRTNEYVMKCIMRVISRAQEGCRNVIEPAITQCKTILMTVSRNPQKPHFNHYMFECIAALIRFACDPQYCKDNQRQFVTKFEAQLMTPFVDILTMDQAAELHPYIYQIIGLMLRIRDSVDGNYNQLFDNLLTNSLWHNDGNIVAISGMFSDYLRLVNVDDFLTETRLDGMLGIFQHLLSKRTQDHYAFRILSAVFQYVSSPKLATKLPIIIRMVCVRISSQKSTALCCNFIIALSVFIVRLQGLRALLEGCNRMQQGIFYMIMDKIWLEYARHINAWHERKIVTIGMTTMIGVEEFYNDKQLAQLMPRIVNTIVEIFEAGPLQSNEQKTTDFYLSKLEEQGAGNKFVGLQFAKSPPHDVCKDMPDPRMILIKTLEKVTTDQQLKMQLIQQTKPIVRQTMNKYAKQFNVNVQFPEN